MPIAQIIALLTALIETATQLYEQANGPSAVAEDAAAAIAALGQVLSEAQAAATLVQTLQTENRDATPAEAAALDNAFAQADAKLSKDIASANTAPAA